MISNEIYLTATQNSFLERGLYSLRERNFSTPVYFEKKKSCDSNEWFNYISVIINNKVLYF